MAQTADENTKPIGLTFALVGLYLHVEKHAAGRDVQRVHMILAREKRSWPTFTLPAGRGSMTAKDVLAAPPGAERDAAIHAWCASVWKPFSDQRPQIAALLPSGWDTDRSPHPPTTSSPA